jgi:hypothetical protein
VESRGAECRVLDPGMVVIAAQCYRRTLIVQGPEREVGRPMNDSRGGHKTSLNLRSWLPEYVHQIRLTRYHRLMSLLKATGASGSCLMTGFRRWWTKVGKWMLVAIEFLLDEGKDTEAVAKAL